MQNLKRTILSVLVMAMAVIFLPGCGGGDSPEALSQDMIANFKEMAAVLNGITDEASAKAAVPKIEKVRANMRECAARAKKLPMPDAETDKKINASMQAGMMEAMTTIGAAQQRLAERPELLAIIEPAMQGMENDL